MINFSINYSRAARYMGEKVMTESTETLLKKLTPLVLNEIEPKFIYKEFSSRFDGLFCGEDIKSHLNNCNSYILTATTLGLKNDLFIRKIAFESVLNQIAVDAISSVIVEQYFENELNKLAKTYSEKGLFLTLSFAPGYGDFPLECQAVLLKLLEADKKIGLSLTDTNLLTPRKSITGVIGISTTKNNGRLATCGHCKMKDNCSFLKDGEHCYD